MERSRTVGVFAALLLVDRLSKLVMMSRDGNGFPSFVFGLVRFTTHRNYGVIANIPVPIWIILLLSTLAVVWILYAIRSTIQRGSWHETMALAILLAGAIGNVWDRLFYGFVFDWILLFGRSVINVADICIGVGLVWFIYLRTKRAPQS